MHCKALRQVRFFVIFLNSFNLGCDFSSYCRDVLDLVDTIVREINLGKVSHGLRHLYTISNIFEMYGAIVPLYWKKLFDSTPRHVGKFCLFPCFLI